MKIIHTLAITLKWLLLVGILVIYWQVRNIDPEGACKGFEYFSRCWDAWANYHPAHNFKKLPSDEEMIKRFYAYNNELEAIKERSSSRGSYSSDYSNLEWKTRHGIYAVYKMIIWPPNVYDSSPSILSANNREWAYKFLVDSTMYIAGAGKEWPWVNRLKGYVYFPLPAPRIEHGLLLGAMQFASGKHPSWRVLPQLNQDWPEDWVSGECLLRRIEPQWFLFLCKDHVGG